MLVNGYLIPANSKKGGLIFNIFRPFDLIMFIAGAAVSLFLLVVVDSNDTLMIILSCLPVGIAGLLVIPIPNYHNVLCAMQSIFSFFIKSLLKENSYKWRGWCIYEKFADEESKK